MNFNQYKCKTCAYLGTTNTGSDACVLYKKIIDKDKDFCSTHEKAQDHITCQICKRSLNASNIIIYQGEDYELYLCDSCAARMGTCATCNYQNECGFRNDHSEPQVINQTVQNGFMTMQTQVKNPHLIEKHCISCRCSYGGKGNCIRDDNEVSCPNWQIVPELRQ